MFFRSSIRMSSYWACWRDSERQRKNMCSIIKSLPVIPAGPWAQRAFKQIDTCDFPSAIFGFRLKMLSFEWNQATYKQNTATYIRQIQTNPSTHKATEINPEQNILAIPSQGSTIRYPGLRKGLFCGGTSATLCCFYRLSHNMQHRFQR